MNINSTLIISYLSGAIALIASFVFGNIIYGLSIIGLLFIILGLISNTKFSIVKFLDVRITALIWLILSVVVSFSPYIFNYTSNKTLLWGSIVLGLFNLVIILISKIKLDEEQKS